MLASPLARAPSAAPATASGLAWGAVPSWWTTKGVAATGLALPARSWAAPMARSMVMVPSAVKVSWVAVQVRPPSALLKVPGL